MPDARVASTTRDVGAEGALDKPYRQSLVGELIMPDYFLQLAIDGKIFCSSDADGDDTISAISGWVVTTPQLLLRVPNGTVAIPMWVNAGHQGATAGATGQYVIMYDNVDRLNTGGVLEAVTPYRTDAPTAATCTVLSTPTAAAANAARVLHQEQYETDNGSTGNAKDTRLEWTAQAHIPPVRVGPAALLLWIDDVAATPAFSWSLGWAEFTSAEMGA